jgi:hypothetical protein
VNRLQYATDAEALQVLDPASTAHLVGDLNTPIPELLAHIRHAIRLGHPQVRAQPPSYDRVILVGGGPSLEATLPELRDLYFAGAKIVTTNGAYQWCLARNLRPSAQVILDARSFNARFVDPPIAQCRYLLASQCHPDTWAAVAGRPDVWIWHAIGPENELRGELDAFYLKCWTAISGGTTVVMRAIALLRTLGFLRMDLFGVDSCVLDGAHHAYPQPENAGDAVRPFTLHPTGHPERVRTFHATAWQAKQLEDFLQMVRINGHQFLLNVHGDGMLAYALQCSADVQLTSLEKEA